MQNPWSQLPDRKPHVLPCDALAVEAYADYFRSQPNLALQTQLMPEPYHGNPSSPFYILSLNPGFSVLDEKWHTSTQLGSALRGNLDHEPSEFPFVYLDPRFSESPGAKWWNRKLKHLIGEFGNEKIANSIFNVELFPYHSKNFKRIPAKYVANRLVPSSEYSAHLVRVCIEQNRPIVIFRSRKQWCELVPELESYRGCMYINNPRNPTISPNNMDEYDRLVELVRHA